MQVAAAEAKANAELKQSLNEMKERMNEEREQALEEARLVCFTKVVGFPLHHYESIFDHKRHRIS